MSPIVLAMVLIGCSSQAPPSPRAAGLQGAVLFLIDTVRADHLSCYGHLRPTSPALSKLAEQGVLFEQVVAAAPWTLPSVRTILSARAVNRAAAGPDKLSASVAESIRRAGYKTAAITEGGYVSKLLGFDLGFDDFVEEEGAVQLVRPDKPFDPEAKGGIDRTFARAKDWISEHRQDRFFLLVHTYEPHAPYTRRTFTDGLEPGNVGETFTIDKFPLLRSGAIVFDDRDLRYLEALYDGGLRETDLHIGEFLDHLQRIGLRDRTLVVVTSDHGEELGEHYRSYCGNHGHSLHDELLLVPLVLCNPAERYPMRRVETQVRTIDVLPTIAEIVGARIDFSIDGKSLLPVMRAEEKEARIAYGGRTRYGPQQSFVRHLGFKYIAVSAPEGKGRVPVRPLPPPEQLYDLASDPRERTNLAAERPEMVREMARLLAALGAAGQEGEPSAHPEEIDAELRERLRSLGYIQ